MSGEVAGDVTVAIEFKMEALAATGLNHSKELWVAAAETVAIEDVVIFFWRTWTAEVE